MGKLGGIALGLGGDGFHAQLIDAAGREGRQDRTESEAAEKHRPERIVLKHVQHPGQPDDAPRRSILRERLIAEDPLALVCEKIGSRGDAVTVGNLSFTAVPADKAAPVVKAVERKHAVVLTAAAAGGLRRDAERGDLLRRAHGGDGRQAGGKPCCMPVSRDEGSPEGAHDARNVRANHLTAGNFFKRAEHSPVVKGPALHDDAGTEPGNIGQPDHLEEGVADDRIGQTRRDVRNGCALFLCLLDIGVHKDRAAGAQVYGRFRKQRLVGKCLGAVAERFREILKKRTAAGGTGLVEHDRVHHSVFQTDALHVLTADVQDAVHLRIKEGRGGAVGNGLHLSVVQAEGRLQQRLAVAGGAAGSDTGRWRQRPVELRHHAAGSLHRIAPVGGIVREEKAPVLSDQGQLGGRGTRVHAEEAVAGIVRKGASPDLRLPVPLKKRAVILLAFKKRFHPPDLKAGGIFTLKAPDQLRDPEMHSPAAGGRACGGKQVGMLRNDHLLRREAERADKRLAELAEVMKRSAQKGDVSADRLAAGKPGHRLVYDRLKNRCGQILPGGALVDQGLNVRFGKDAAAGSNGIELGAVLCGLVQPGGIGVQECRHLVDKGTCPARADTVHAFVKAAAEIDDLCILTAELDRDVGLRCAGLDGLRHGDDFLEKRQGKRVGEAKRARPCETYGQGAVSKPRLRLLQKLRQSFPGACVMPPIAPVEQRSVLCEDHEFDGGRANIDPRPVYRVCYDF